MTVISRINVLWDLKALCTSRAFPQSIILFTYIRSYLGMKEFGYGGVFL